MLGSVLDPTDLGRRWRNNDWGTRALLSEDEGTIHPSAFCLRIAQVLGENLPVYVST